MSVQGVVILDEQDSSVVFTGQWDHYADPVQYKGISTGSKTAGTTCSLNFTGTSILVATTIVRSGPFSLQFILDGKLYTNSTTGFDSFANNLHSYHDATFAVDNLSDGEHQLTISNTMNTDDINIYLDYFLYTSSSQTNLSDLNLFVDDRDSSLVYAGNWRFDTADSDFRHTSRAADNTSAASLTIPFTGNGIQFYGLINSGAVGDMLLAEFVLDTASTTTYAPPAQTSDITYNNMIFDSGPLSQGPHTLVVTPKNDHLVWIDYVLVHQAVMTQAPSTSTLSSATTPTNLGTNSTNTAVASPRHTGVRTATIAGVAIAGVVIIVLIILAIFIVRKKRRARLSKPTDELENPLDQQNLPSPFTYSPQPGTGPVTLPVQSTASSIHSIPPFIGNPPPRKLLGLQPYPGPSTPSTIHTDSGIRIPPESVLESPPGYTAD